LNGLLTSMINAKLVIFYRCIYRILSDVIIFDRIVFVIEDTYFRDKGFSGVVSTIERFIFKFSSFQSVVVRFRRSPVCKIT